LRNIKNREKIKDEEARDFLWFTNELSGIDNEKLPPQPNSFFWEINSKNLPI
jgi:hypothetical protein